MADVEASVNRKVIQADIQTNKKIGASLHTKGEIAVTMRGHTYVYDKDYEHLDNKPSIENVTLSGNKELQELGLSEISNQEITDMLNKVFDD